MTQLEITKINETKNFLNFKEKISDLEICLMKEDYKRALTRFMYWKKNTNSTNFTAQLFNLICKADDLNKINFLKGFPAETIIWLLWYAGEEIERFKNGNKN